MQPKFYFLKVSKLLLAIVCFCAYSVLLTAEGSKDFWGYPGYRLFYNAEQQQQLKVFAKAGEFINVGASHIGLTGGFIIVYRPDGTVAARFDGADNTTAIIHNHIEELEGPTGGGTLAGTGYVPGVVQVLAENEGVWTIEMGFPNPTRDAFENIMNGAPWDRATDQPLVQRVVLAWDITVTQGAAGNESGPQIEGRVYSNEYISIQNGNNIETSPSFYILTKDGYVYQIDFNDTDPWGFPLFSNSFGVVNGNQQPTYSSFADSLYTRSSNPSEWLSNNNYLYNPQSKDIGSLINNKIFFNPPDETMPAKAMVTDIFSQDSHTTWLFQPLSEGVPQLTDIAFRAILSNTDTLCDPAAAALVGQGGFICFSANSNGTASVALDMNNNGSFDDPVDRNLSAFVSIGRDSVYWDGRDGLGNIIDVTPNLIINYNIQSKSGEVHIMMLDVENNPGGITFTRLNGLDSPDASFFYDHTAVGGGISGGVAGDPQVTTTPYTYTDRFGDNLLLDYWTFIEFPNPASGAFTLNITNNCTSPAPRLVDTDQDGRADAFDLDDDNDGIPDLLEYCNRGSEIDCFANSIDPSGDEDGDLIPNYQDANDPALSLTCADSNADGVCDQLDLRFDLDGDQVPDHLDLDSDNDGITDLWEAGHGQADLNGDGIIDGDITAFGENGLFNNIATHADSLTATINYFIADTDKDQVPDYKDLDTDNDGIHDVLEGNYGFADTNNDGRIDDGEGNIPDVTVQGIPIRMIQETIDSSSLLLPPDTDGDGVLDWQDLDTDNDGINDVLENKGLDSDNDGLIGMGLPQVNDNGLAINTAIILTTSIGVNTDEDEMPDFRDLDSDADGLFDVREVNQSDPDNDGIIGMGIPNVNRNGQGISDPTGTTIEMISSLIDRDGDNLPDFQDIDRDGDGILDQNECPDGWPCLDSDGDSVLNIDDLDSDGDLLPDAQECPDGFPCVDADSNGLPNYLQYTCHALNTPVIQIATTSITNLCEGTPLQISVARIDTFPVDTFTYQWTGANDFSLEGKAADISSLTLEGLDTSGSYSLVVTTPQGCVSNASSVMVELMDSIAIPTLQIDNPLACEGEDILLSVDSIGIAISSYDWFFDNRDTTIQIATTTERELALTNINTMSTGNYLVQANIEGCTATRSAPVALAVSNSVDTVELFAIAFTEDPVCAGSPLTLSVFEIDMEDVVYEWYGPNGLVATGTNIEIDTTQVENSGDYYAAIKVGTCTVESNKINLTIKPRPEKVPSVLLSTASFCEGDALTLSTESVTGDSISYQWYFDNGTSQELIATTKDTLLSLENLAGEQSGNYAVQVNMDGCTSDMSAVQELSIHPSLEGIAITTSLTDTTNLVCGGSTVQLNIAALDSTAIVNWTGPNDFSLLESAIELSAFTPEQAGSYRAEITQGNCTSNSEELSLQYIPGPTVPEIDIQEDNICPGATVNLTATTIADGEVTYEWYFNGMDLEEEPQLLATNTTNNFAIENAMTTASGTYSVVAMIGACVSEPSDPFLLLIDEPIVLETTSSLSENSIACEGTAITLTTTQIEGATYEWVGPRGVLSNAANTLRIAGAGMNQSGTYFARVTTADGCMASSNEVDVTIVSMPSQPIITFAKDGFCEGEEIALSILSPESNEATLYEWYKMQGDDLELIETTTLPALRITDATETDAGEYVVIANIGECSSPTSEAQFINVQGGIEAAATSSAQSLTPACKGDAVSFDVTAIEGATYEWYGPDGLFSGLQNPEVAVASPEMSGRYFAVVTVGGCSVTTEPIDVLVNEVPNVPELQVDENSICTGEQLQLNATITNGLNINYNWFLNTSDEKELIASTQEPTLIIDKTDLPSEGQYSVEVSVDGCTSSVSNIQNISVAEALGELRAISNATLSNPVCEGERVIVTATNVEGAEYEWYGRNGLISRNKGFTLPNATTEDAGKYYAQITVGGCTRRTNEIDVIVNNQPPAPALQVRENNICIGDQIDLATAAYSGFSVRYNWYFNDGVGEDVLITTTPAPNFSYQDAVEGVSGNYLVEVLVDGCTSARSNSVFVNVQSSLEEVEAFSTIVSDKPICEGEEVSFFTNPIEGATYEWFGPNGFTSAQARPSIVTSSIAQSGEYYAVVTFDGCASITNEVNVRVVPKPEKPEIFVQGSLCAGEVLELSASSFESEDVSYSWIFSDGKNESVLAVTDIPTYPISNTNTSNSGFYSVQVNVNGCTASSSDGERVEIQAPLEDMVITSSKSTACTGDVIDFTAPFVAGATYEWFGPNNFSSSLATPSIEEAVMESTGEYFAVISLNGCPNTTSKIALEVKSQPEQPFLVADEEEVCVAEAAVLRATNSPGVITNREIYYQWYQETTNQRVGETQEGILRIENASKMDAGNYFVELTNEGCTSDPSNMVQLEVDEAPEESAFILDESSSFCAQSRVVVEAVNPTIGTGQWSVANADATIVDASNPMTTITDLERGGNTIIWSLSYKGCDNYSSDTLIVSSESSSVSAENDEFTININRSLAAANLLENDRVSGVANYDIKIINRPAFGKASIDELGQIEYTPTPNFFGYDELEYEICDNACDNTCDRATVRINIVDETQDIQCFAPNVITPNGDGLNDGLRIPCVEQMEAPSEIKIFNRWGDLVYQTADYRNEWIGTFNGNPLPPGTYFYLLRVGNDQNKCLQGYFQLLR